MAIEERTGRYRLYRVVPSVLHLNLQETTTGTLYTSYQSGYDESTQRTIDGLSTGELIEATLSGDPEAETDPWRLGGVERVGGVLTDFVTETELPDVARDCWGAGRTGPTWTTLTKAGEAVGACGVQPRTPLPDGAFVPNVLAGLLPLEPLFQQIPGLGEPPAELLFVDADAPTATSYTEPYGVVLAFTRAGAALADEYRDRWELPRGADSRPAYDPYGL